MENMLQRTDVIQHVVESDSKAEFQRGIWGTAAQWLPAVSVSSWDAESSVDIQDLWDLGH